MLFSRPHRRFNPLLNEWVLVSPQRTERPWQGQREVAGTEPVPAFDPGCYLCPNNARAGGTRNPAYGSTYVFDNDFPALTPPAESEAGADPDPHPLLTASEESGVCRVVCFSPRHDLTLPRLGLAAIGTVIDTWIAEYRALGARPGIRSVSIFENRGAMMGASNPHPHGQIWASAHIPNLDAREQAALLEHRARYRQCLLCEYAELESAWRERVVCENAGFVALVPFWATWPFETLLISKPHRGGLDHPDADLDTAGRAHLADILQRLGTRYDNLFQTPFPLSWGFHLPPTDGAPHPECHLHAHFLPPLLRSATVRKFMVGYELLATPQRDLTPEQAAQRLRDVAERHYLDGA